MGRSWNQFGFKINQIFLFSSAREFQKISLKISICFDFDINLFGFFFSIIKYRTETKKKKKLNRTPKLFKNFGNFYGLNNHYKEGIILQCMEKPKDDLMSNFIHYMINNKIHNIFS